MEENKKEEKDKKPEKEKKTRLFDMRPCPLRPSYAAHAG